MKIFSLIFLLTLSIAAVGQYQFEPQNNYNFQNKPQGFMQSLPPAPPGEVGSAYVHEEFNKADIFLKDSTKLDDVFMRIDARTNVIEIKYENTIKVLPVGRVLLTTVNISSGRTEKFISGDILNIAENPFKGKLLQVHYEGNVSLLSRTVANIKPGNTNPNPMSNMGAQRDNEIILETLYFITVRDTLVDASQSKSKFRREIINKFGEDAEALAKETNNKNLGELVALTMELDNRSKPK
jgi:hypothetical protein